jgi:hypothetical protein
LENHVHRAPRLDNHGSLNVSIGISRSFDTSKQEGTRRILAYCPRISSLEFKLDHAVWDERRRELSVVYEANLNGERKRACEIMQFDTSGRQIRGEALYGAII